MTTAPASPLDLHWRMRLETISQALEANNFGAHIAETLDDARDLVLGKVLPEATAALNLPAGSKPSVSFGGSMTLSASGLHAALKARTDLTVLDTLDYGLPAAEFVERRRQALLCDVFITGTNAVTADGQLVNLDGTGNRVAGITFGPRKVILLVGRNKLAADMDAAMRRIRETAGPANALRLNKKTPCAKTGRCHDCSSPERICNTWVICAKSFPEGRIQVVLINQDLGL